VGFLYLSPTRSRLFAALPEPELPRGFRRGVVREWVPRIPSQWLRAIVSGELDEALSPVKSPGGDVEEGHAR
jgi:hypothetical protein